MISLSNANALPVDASLEDKSLDDTAQHAAKTIVTSTRVADLMTRDVVTLEKEQAMPLAQELMRMLHIRNLPVVDEEKNFVGLVTQQSLLAAQVELLSQTNTDENMERELSFPVAKVMTTTVTTVPSDMLAVDALELMVENKEPSLPVVDQGKLVGIVTVKDFLELALKNLRDTNAATPATAAPASELAALSPAALIQRWLIVALLGVILFLILILVFREFQSSTVTTATTPARALDNSSETTARPALDRPPSERISPALQRPSISEPSASSSELNAAAPMAPSDTETATTSTRGRAARSPTQRGRNTTSSANSAAQQPPSKKTQSKRWVPEIIPDPY